MSLVREWPLEDLSPNYGLIYNQLNTQSSSMAASEFSLMTTARIVFHDGRH